MGGLAPGVGNEGLLFGESQAQFLAQKCCQLPLDVLCFLLWPRDYVSLKVNPFDPLFDATFRAFTMAVRETQRHPGPRFCEPGARAMPPLA